MQQLRFNRCGAKAGTVTTMVALTVVILGGTMLAFFTMTTSSHKQIQSQADGLRATYFANGAVSEALATYKAGGRDALEEVAYAKGFGLGEAALDATWGADEKAMDDDLVRLVGQAAAGDEQVAVELLFRILDGDSTPGISAKDQITLKSNAVVDSYDSSLGTYDSQATNKFKGQDYADSDAPLTSNGDIDLSANSAIWGDANPGPAGSTTVAGGSVVSGSTAPLPAPVDFPPLVVPPLPSFGNISLNGGTMTIPPGNHSYTFLDISSNSTLEVVGPANVVFRDVNIASNSQVVVDAAKGPVNFYVKGQFNQLSNTSFGPTSENPADLSLYIAKSSPDVHFDSYAEFTGTVYAPERHVSLFSYSEIWGSLAAKEITVHSNSKVHFDEYLHAAAAGSNEVEVLVWRRIPSE